MYSRNKARCQKEAFMRLARYEVNKILACSYGVSWEKYMKKFLRQIVQCVAFVILYVCTFTCNCTIMNFLKPTKLSYLGMSKTTNSKTETKTNLSVIFRWRLLHLNLLSCVYNYTWHWIPWSINKVIILSITICPYSSMLCTFDHSHEICIQIHQTLEQLTSSCTQLNSIWETPIKLFARHFSTVLQ